MAEFIEYLLAKEDGHEGESQKNMRSRHHRNQLKSHVINMLYALMYTEQRYSFSQVSTITKNFNNTFEQIDKILSTQIDINRDDIYTE